VAAASGRRRASGAVIRRCYDSAALTVESDRATRIELLEDPLTRIRELTRNAVAFVIWLAAAVAIALGAAGIVAGMDSPAADGSDRTGRTRHGDAVVDASLDEIEAQMRHLSVAIASLNDQARVILASLASNEFEPADAATAVGAGLVADIEGRAERIQDALDAVPIVGTPAAEYELTPATGDRYSSYLGGLASTRGIADAWTRLTVASLSASRMSDLLAAHDAAVVAAAAEGRKAAYARALRHLDDADAAIADARTLRDRLAATVDVATIDEWLDRSSAYDVALRALYVAVQRADGRVTDAVREAMRKEEAAKARLPPDTRSLVLIMSDIGRGGMNASAIEIEQAHADLEEALAPPLAAPSP
jgi:hypothetical protein